MDKMISVAAVGCLLLFLCGCTDTNSAANAAQWSDKRASVTCFTYGQLTFNGWSTGRIEYDEGGKISFVDQANGRYTVIEGDCRVVYAR